MESPLSFSATEQYRKALLLKNLKPYNDDGFTPTSRPGETDLIIDNQSVIDSLEVEVIGEGESENAYVKNLYGPEGGYGLPIDIEDVFFSGIITSPGKEPYYTFVASTYNPLSILTSDNPQGNNGSLSQDSALARIAAESLKTEFEYRVAEETFQQTVGRINAIDAVSDPYELLAIATGNRSVIERDWKISVPNNVIAKGLDFISRISGVYSPYSWIPGDYFSAEPRQLFINQAANAVTSLFTNDEDDNGNQNTFDTRGGLKLPTEKTGMQTFLDNTGGGQRSRLFKGLAMNRYIPDYNKNFLTDLFTDVPPQNYYVGSSQQEVSNMVAPQDSLPLDQDGNKAQSPVFGYDEVAKTYENEQKENQFKFGLNQTSTYDGGGVQGGLTWVSPKSKDSAGQKVGKGGEFYGTIDSDWRDTGIKTKFQANQSVGGEANYQFTKGSILDNTQKLINSADEVTGERRLQHVGNAINQVSKVFHDGTRELTKGSRVIAYVDENNEIVGKEYCRVFTKDTPYYSMADLQKSDGMTNENRRFSYSVLDKTYNLNIAPIRGDRSTNLTGNNFSNEGVKKYMFSIENLAWKTSNKPGFTYQDLPHCERGPNEGRIMWFPPYDISVSEQVRAGWNSNEFLGRPEPVYTYTNTERTGTLSWKIVVDHPSILNAIVDKELSGENNQRINDIVDSFFAGCRKYDIYDLAVRFPQFTYRDIYEIITKYPEPEIVREAVNEVGEVQPVDDQTPTTEQPENIIQQDDYDFGIYFDHDTPGPKNANSTDADESYEVAFVNYTASTQEYKTNADENQNEPIQSFFENNINPTLGKIQNLAKKVSDALDGGKKQVILEITSSASSPGTENYNLALSERRIDSFKQYFSTFKDTTDATFADLIESKKIVIKATALGEDDTAGEFNCTEDLEGNNRIYSVNAMACRRVKITNVTEIPEDPEPEETTDNEELPPTSGDNTDKPASGEPKREVRPQSSLTQRQEVAKIIVRKLLTECDYFDLLEEQSPMVYDGIKEKIKYFQPAFHSITPEGLNSRLTFLQQCLRPGDTIPVIGTDGKPTENDARNTAFGAPPICILRIGDFYHTKIAINQIGIQYEPLTFDLNPEGIGVQPMIASITMSFFFIGGQGLKEPVNRLQNALSFNYYANTEVYDERSVATEDTSELNKEIWEDIQSQTEFGNRNRTTEEDTPGIGNTIGVEFGEQTLTDYPGFTGETTISGQTRYQEIFKDLVDNSQSYVQSVTDGLIQVFNEYSSDGFYYLTDSRYYTDGKMLGLFGSPTGTTQDINLFGKPYDIEIKVNNLFELASLDVDDDSSPLLKGIENRNIKNSVIRKYKKRIKEYINSKRNGYTTIYNNVINSLSKSQLELSRTIDKLNFVLTNSDGYQVKSGKNVLLDLTPFITTTNQELVSDMTTVGNDLQNYYDGIFNGPDSLSKGKTYSQDFDFSSVESPYNSDAAFIRFMYISLKDVTTNPNNFIQELLGEDLYNNQPELRSYVESLVLGNLTPQAQQNVSGGNGDIYSIYLNLLVKSTNSINKFKEKSSVSKFKEGYSSELVEKERVFNYVKVPTKLNDSVKENNFISLYKPSLPGSDSFNLKTRF